MEICRVLLDSGEKVLGVSRSKPAPLLELMSAYPNRFIHISIDLGDLDAIDKIMELVNESNIALKAFVNNAALAYDDLITNLNRERLEAMYQVNVINPMVLTKAVLRNFLLHDSKGALLNISSISVHTGYKGLSMYASTKGAFEALSKNIAREWGEMGIRSNNLVCGFMETDMSASLSDEQKRRIYARTSLKKATTLRSAAEMAAFLIGENAESITGQNIFVDSGTI